MSFNNTQTPRKFAGKAKWQIPMKGNRYVLEGELKERFCRLFPVHTNRRLMKWFGISFITVQRFKRLYGLQKDMDAVRREQARDTKRMLEENGYYDSIRGKKPSEEAVRKTREMRAAGFNPILAFKEKHPRKFRAMVKRSAEKRSALMEQERRRLRWGMPQKTKLRVSIAPLSRLATGQKYAMIKKNNYFADPDHSSWVCYDSDTRRSPRSEATAIKHGLRIVAADNDKEQQ